MSLHSVGFLFLLGTLSMAPDAKPLPSLPDPEGFAGPYAGVSHNALLVAGGANFPDKKPWEGGKKVWYDQVFVLERPEGVWKQAGKLPRRLGYGVSVTHQKGVICVGGSDADRHYADVFRLEFHAGKLVTTPLPALPVPLANGCGAMVGDVLYVAGGQEKPDGLATPMVYQIDLAESAPRWKEVERFPGKARILAAAAGFQGAFWLAGGASLVLGSAGTPERQYLRDVYRYEPGKGWKRIADMPRPRVAAPSPSPTSDHGFFLLGGDDGSQLRVKPDKHIGFSKDIWYYDVKSDTWSEAGSLSAPRVTVPCVLWHQSWVLPSGEMRPGTRSPQVWSYSPIQNGVSR